MSKECKDIDFQKYEHYVVLETPFVRSDGIKNICVDKCLKEELLDLWFEKCIVTTGCCCGHDKIQGYIQVIPENCNDMLELGYEQLPLNNYGNGKWCFKPKTTFKYMK